VKIRVVKKAQKNHPATKMPEGDGFTPSGRPKKKTPALENLFPLRKKNQKNSSKSFFPNLFLKSKYLEIISNQIFFKKFFDFLS